MWHLTAKQIDSILTTVPENSRMLEWGSGEASKKFIRSGVSLTSIEHNEAMQNTGGDFRLRLPIIRTHHTPQYILDWSDYIQVPDIADFQTILIDGECRGECLAYVAHHNPDATVWLHDTQRKLYGWATSMYETVQVVAGHDNHNNPNQLEQLRCIKP